MAGTLDTARFNPMDTHGANTETRERIAEIAIRHFVRFGARAVTMDDIAGDLHMSKKTLYEHFRDKEGLLAYCLNKMTEEAQTQRRNILAEADNVIEGFVRVLRQVMNQMQQVNPLFLIDLERHYPRVLVEAHQSREDLYFRDSAVLIEEGIREGCFIDDLDTEVVVRLLFVQIDALSNSELFPPNRFDRSALVRQVLVGFIRAIATQQGHRLLDELLSAEAA